MQRMRRYGGFALLALALCALVPAGVAAKTFKPTRLDDPVADGCKKNDCSLREAVIKANARPGPDVIRLKEGTYEIELAFGDAPQADGLDVFSEIDIRGAGTAQTRIDGNGIDRPIEIGAGITAANMDVTLERLTLTGGDAGAATAGNGDSSGGGVVAYRAEALTLRRVLITGNERGAVAEDDELDGRGQHGQRRRRRHLRRQRGEGQPRQRLDRLQQGQRRQRRRWVGRRDRPAQRRRLQGQGLGAGEQRLRDGRV